MSLTVALPDGVFEEAALLTKARVIVDQLTDAAKEIGGEVEFDVVTPKPRGAKDDAPASKSDPAPMSKAA